jgi:uncharacterized protein (DUF488 family)
MNPLFTVGHSVLEMPRFLDLLQSHRVQVVADVRSTPTSGRSPHFNKDTLKATLKLHNIQYVFLGRELGARRAEKQAYEGRIASYARIARLEAFASGLTRIRSGANDYRIALMCAEKDPLQCHRTILVCRHLKSDFGDRLFHILDSGQLERHQDSEARLVLEEGLQIHQADAFSSPEDVLNRAYDKRGLAIAYQEHAYEDSHNRLY